MRLLGAVLLLIPCFGQSPRPISHSVFNGTVNIQPRRSHIVPVNVPTSAVDPKLVGYAEARGGTGNDIRVLVVTDSNRVLFDSGQQRSPRFNVSIAQPGTYRLIIDNGFSALSQKTVYASVSLQTVEHSEQNAEPGAAIPTRDPYENSLIPPNSRVYIDDNDVLGPLYRAVLTKRGVPLIVASDASTAPYAVKQSVHADLLTLSLVEEDR